MSEQLLLITHHSSLITFFMSAVPTDETLIIETPERVPLHFALASIGNRFLACAFDHFLQIVVMLVVLLLLLAGRRRGVVHAPEGRAEVGAGRAHRRALRDL